MSGDHVLDDGWRRQVMESMPRPAWLSADAPHSQIVISARVRLMRNLAGRRFPHRCDRHELESVCEEVVAAAGDRYDVHRRLVAAERDLLVGWRMASPEFAWTAPGRALLVDRSRTVSVMVNEEDHLRVQALSAGWSIETARAFAEDSVAGFRSTLQFAEGRFGYLAASPFNVGAGRRYSAMFHLIGLAQSHRLKAVLKALAERSLMVRGVFGEASRAVGAITQVSLLNGDLVEFVGACEYLIRVEREARKLIPRASLIDRAERTREFALRSSTIGLADAMRALAWLRWADQEELPGFVQPARAIDATLAQLDLRSETGELHGGRRRAHLIHALIDGAS